MCISMRTGFLDAATRQVAWGGGRRLASHNSFTPQVQCPPAVRLLLHGAIVNRIKIAAPTDAPQSVDPYARLMPDTVL